METANTSRQGSHSAVLSLQFVVILAVMAFIGLLVHEFGHGLSAVFQGGEIDGIYVFPGIEIYPDFGTRYQGDYPNNPGLARTSPGQPFFTDAQSGFVTLMGAGATFAFSVVGLFGLYILAPRKRLLQFVWVALAIWYLDIVTYTFLPSIGLRHWIIIGGSNPEPLNGAERMGISSGLFMAYVAVVGILWTAAIIAWISPTRRSQFRKPVLLSSGLLVLIGVAVVSYTMIQNGPLQLPEAISNNLELAFDTDGACQEVSVDGTLLATTNNIYALTTGEARLTTGSNTRVAGFSPDGRLALVYTFDSQETPSGGVYDTATGEQLTAFPTGFEGAYFAAGGRYLATEVGLYDAQNGDLLLDGLAFAPDETPWIVVLGDGVYNAETLERAFAIPEGNPSFYQIGSSVYLSVFGHGLYSVPSGELIFDPPIDARVTALYKQPDGKILVHLENNGIYDLVSGEQVLALEPNVAFEASSDRRWGMVRGDAVYDLATGESLLDLRANTTAVFSPDGNTIYISDDGVYDLPSGELRFSVEIDTDVHRNFPNFRFNDDGSLLAIEDAGVFDSVTGDLLMQLGFIGGDLNIHFLDTGSWLINTGDALYDLSNATRVVDVPFGWAQTDEGVVVLGVGVYDPQTLEMVRALPLLDTEAISAGSVLTEQMLLHISAEGLFDINTGEKLFGLRGIEVAWISDDAQTFVLNLNTNPEVCAVYRWAP